MPLTPLEASITAQYDAESLTAPESGPKKSVPIPTTGYTLVLNSTIKKFGTSSMDLADKNYKGASFGAGSGKYAPYAAMQMECWAYIKGNVSTAQRGGWLMGVKYPNSYTTKYGIMVSTSGELGLYRMDYGGNVIRTFQPGIALNQWHHIVLTNNQFGCSRVYLNGQMNSATMYFPNTTDESRLDSEAHLGSCGDSGSYPANALIDDCRWVFGMTDIYSTPITVPSAALPDTSGSDPLYNSTVKILLHGDGANGGTTITDSGPNPITLVQGGSSNVTTSTLASKFGGSSLRFGGTNQWLKTSSALAAFAIGSNEVCIECWVRFDLNTSTLHHIWQIGNGLNNRFNLNYNQNNNILSLYMNNGDGAGRGCINYVVNLTDTQFHHIALVKEAGTWGCWTMYVDGLSVASADGYTTNAMSARSMTGNMELHLGFQGFSGLTVDYFYGYIDDFRVSIGTGAASRYTMNFTPPTSPLPVPGADYTVLAQQPKLAGATQVSPTYKFKVGTPFAVDAAMIKGAKKDMYYGGAGMVVGFTKEQNLPTPTVYAPRRLLLIRERENIVVAETWSNGYTGAYAFMYVDMNAKYTIVAYDHTNTYAAEVATGVTPELATFP